MHVGGLVALRDNPGFANALLEASIVYPDGISIVAIQARRGDRSQRCPTTDLGPALIADLCAARHDPRVALIGGPPGLAEAAATRLRGQFTSLSTCAESGFHEDWGPVLARVREFVPHLVFVGLGAPREMEWCVEHRAGLPNALIVTCGGWFGFVAGREVRAPRTIQRLGLEWVWRLAQQPRRLMTRYLRGALATARLLAIRGEQGLDRST